MGSALAAKNIPRQRETPLQTGCGGQRFLGILGTDTGLPQARIKAMTGYNCPRSAVGACPAGEGQVPTWISDHYIDADFRRMTKSQLDPLAQFLAKNWFMYSWLTEPQRQVVLSFTRTFCANAEFWFSPEIE